MKSLIPGSVFFAAPAIALHFAPEGVRAALIFDHLAVADGQWWRLLTGHWIHFGVQHLALNLVCIVAISAWLELTKPGAVKTFTFVAAPLLSGMLFCLEPAMRFYGGLSGVSFGLGTLLSLTHLTRTKNTAHRIYWILALVMIAVKSIVDVTSASWSIVNLDSTVRVSLWAHASGALLALGAFLSLRLKKFRPLTWLVNSPHEKLA